MERDRCGRFKKNHNGYWSGKERTEETKLKISLSKKGKTFISEATKKKMSRAHKKLFKSGISKPTRWNKGLTKETDEKVKKNAIEIKRSCRFGVLHLNWKGDEVSYRALHSWVRRHKTKPKFCEVCKTNEPKDVANKSGSYKRDVEDYIWICRKCHMKSDGRYIALKNGLTKGMILK